MTFVGLRLSVLFGNVSNEDFRVRLLMWKLGNGFVRFTTTFLLVQKQDVWSETILEQSLSLARVVSFNPMQSSPKKAAVQCPNPPFILYLSRLVVLAAGDGAPKAVWENYVCVRCAPVRGRSLGFENFGSSFPNVDGINMDKPSDNDHAIESTGWLTIVIVFVVFLITLVSCGHTLFYKAKGTELGSVCEFARGVSCASETTADETDTKLSLSNPFFASLICSAYPHCGTDSFQCSVPGGLLSAPPLTWSTLKRGLPEWCMFIHFLSFSCLSMPYSN